MEFLIARNLASALVATGLEAECRAAFASLNIDLDELMGHELDPALGNGGLGRLAACFLDSMASLGVPATGYGIRFAYGMFRQELEIGLAGRAARGLVAREQGLGSGSPERGAIAFALAARCITAAIARHWVDTEDVFAVAYDLLVPGQGQRHGQHVAAVGCGGRSSLSTSPPSMPGATLDASAERIRAETARPASSIPMIPRRKAASCGCKQEHFFVSASLQDVLPISSPPRRA